jgi:hypothetical protein
MRNTLDFLAMAVTALAISWATVDLYGRATDPHSRQHRSRGNHTDTVRVTSAPKAEGEGDLITAPPVSLFRSSALASPSFPATSMAGHSTQEGPHEDLGSFPGILPRHSPINPPKEVRHGPETAYIPHLKRTEDLVTRHTARATSQEVSPPTGRIKRPALAGTKPRSSPATHFLRGGRCEITTYGVSYRRSSARTSSGAPYNYKALTCAVNRVKGRPALPYGTWIKVTHGKNSVICKITDTGGHKPRGAKIWFDLSCAAMAELMGKPLDPQRAYNTRFFATFEVVKTPVSVAVTARRKR